MALLQEHSDLRHAPGAFQGQMSEHIARSMEKDMQGEAGAWYTLTHIRLSTESV